MPSGGQGAGDGDTGTDRFFFFGLVRGSGSTWWLTHGTAGVWEVASLA